MSLKAVVTGGTGGIGQAVCRRLAENGYFVYIGWASSQEKAEVLAREINGQALKLDVTSDADIAEAAKGENCAALLRASARLCERTPSHFTPRISPYLFGTSESHRESVMLCDLLSADF